MELLTMKELNSKERIALIQSQKASALFKHIAAHNAYAIPQDWDTPKAIVLHTTDTALHVRSAGKEIGYPCFLRTCPEHARAGVLESIRCDGLDELVFNWAKLSEQMKDKDPNGCLILMPFIPAKVSSVMALSYPMREVIKDKDGVTTGELGDYLYKVVKDGEGNETTVQEVFSGYAMMGVGHDGVTAGHGFNLAFPLRDDISKVDSDSKILNALGFDPHFHECEFVFNTVAGRRIEESAMRGVLDSVNVYASKLTQYRKAPEHTPVHPPPEGVDVIGMVPQGVVEVKEVFKATGLEEVAWLEENITVGNCPDGFVVQEVGGSRLSHIYAHCRGVGVPYIISHVEVGDRWVEAAMGWVVLDPDSKWEPKPYRPEIFIDDFKRGIEAGNVYWRRQQGWFSTFFHQWVSLPMSKPQHVSFLAGVFSAWLAKAILALGLGEMRHARNLKKNANAPLFATITACVGKGVWQKINSTPHLDTSRQDYYAAIEHLELDWSDTASLLDFLAKNFNKGWASSYGGPKWGESMEAGAKLSRELKSFMDNPNVVYEDGETALMRLIRAVNTCENCVHNNGFLFNKWLSKKAFDSGTAGFNPRSSMGEMAGVFTMARQLLDKDFLLENTDNTEMKMERAEPPVNDWSAILKFVGKKTPTYWRNNPIALSNKAPDSLKDIMTILPTRWRHGDKGPHNIPASKDFVMCGVVSCQVCEAHIKWATHHPKAVSLPALHGIKQLFDNNSASLMIAPAQLDVWLNGSLKETRASIKAQVSLIKAKEFNPSPAEFMAIVEGLDESDLDTPANLMVLNKWLAKKGEDLPKFLEAVTGLPSGDTEGFKDGVEQIEGEDNE